MPGQTGLFFAERTPEALVEAVQRFLDVDFDPVAVRQNALRFDVPVFRRRFAEFVAAKVEAEDMRETPAGMAE